MNRPLTASENLLVRWMLEHGKPGATSFLPQVDLALVTPWKCQCGCASINFVIQGQPELRPGINPIGNYVFGSETELSGIFVYEHWGYLGGIEVHGLAGEAPKLLPSIESLRPWADSR